MAEDESARWQLFDRTAALVAGAGDVRGPVVVVVEDLQWVDTSSADFLRFLLSRLATERVAVVATVRTDGLAARPRVRRLVGELGRLPMVRRIDLQPFGREEVAAYLDRLADDRGSADVDEVLRRTGGNPYYVQALVAMGADAAPAALADLLAGRVDGLPDDARAVVRCAAVVPGVVPDRLLRRVSGLPDDVFDAAARHAVADGVLRPEGAGYRFAHDLVRSAVSADLLPGERARLHGRVADALEAGAGGQVRAAEVAHHVAEAQDAPRVLAWSVTAGDDAMRVWAAGRGAPALRAGPLRLGGGRRRRGRRGGERGPGRAAGDPRGRARRRAGPRRRPGASGHPSSATRTAMPSGPVQARVSMVRVLVAADATAQALGPAEEAVRLAGSADVDAVSSALAHVVLARALLGARRTSEARAQSDRALLEARAAGRRRDRGGRADDLGAARRDRR